VDKQNITLGDEIFSIIDVLEKISVADSFVVPSNKIGGGNGEAKLYVGQRNNQIQEFFGDRYFEVDSFLSRHNLINYLDNSYSRYIEPTLEYRKKDELPILWRKRYQEVKEKDPIIHFKVKDQGQLEGPRVYINTLTDTKVYTLLREIPLPIISYINIYKIKDVRDKIFFYFTLHLTDTECSISEKESVDAGIKEYNIEVDIIDISFEPHSEIIELDTDIVEESKSSIYPYEPTLNDLDMSSEQFSVFEYLRQKDKEKIITQPDFQRNLVWKDRSKSKFIESILLNFPIPFIYLNEIIEKKGHTAESKYMIIDGLQRTSTLESFYKNQFKLTDLDAIPQYNGFTFEMLPEILKTKFEDKKLNIFVLKPSTPMEVVYDLFNRINTGGTQLNRQEVRNCIYIGKSTRLLKELSEKEYFKRAISYGVSPIRMKDRELILRYIAFNFFDFKNKYEGNISGFIENAMKEINMWDDERIEKLKFDFKRVMEWTHRIWGDKNFRIPTEKTRGTINMAIFETICYSVSKMSDEYIIKYIHHLRKGYDNLIDNDVYYDAVTRSTNSKIKVDDRFRLAEEILIIDRND